MSSLSAIHDLLLPGARGFLHQGLSIDHNSGSLVLDDGRTLLAAHEIRDYKKIVMARFQAWRVDGGKIRPSDPAMVYFNYNHLPPELQSVSKQFHDLATFIVEQLPRNAQRTVALQKLLEAKDAAVRAKVDRQTEESHDESKGDSSPPSSA